MRDTVQIQRSELKPYYNSDTKNVVNAKESVTDRETALTELALMPFMKLLYTVYIEKVIEKSS